MSPYIIPGLKFKEVRTSNTDNIIQSVCDCFGLNFNDIKTRERKVKLVTARHLCYYFLRKYTNKNLKEIGSNFNQSHANVIKSLEKIDGFIKIKDAVTLNEIYLIENLFDKMNKKYS